MCNLKFRKPKEIPVVYHNYHFILKELTKAFDGNLIVCEKILENAKISYKLRFIASAFSKLVDKLTEGSHEI